MNKRQKIVQKQFIHNEEAVINRLKQVYGQSLKDVTAKAKKLDDEIKELTDIYNDVEDEAEKAVLKSRIQSKVYQKKYQDGLKKQVSDILDKMHDEEFKTVSDYLNKCYDEAFVGTLYDLQGQGIPLAFPIDQEAVTRAVQIDSKISQGLYERLGEDVDVLKKKIVAQVSRGISTGASFKMVAKQLASYTNIGYNNAVRIARTEGHRIQCQSTMDACYKAREKGAELFKEWDATLDAKTRVSHAMVDGERKELDEKFGNGLMFPGDPHGGAAEVINCRCALLQRGRWLKDSGFTKMNNFTKQLESFESPEAYEDFKKGFFSKENRQYMNYVQKMEERYGTKDFRKVLDGMNTREYNHYSKLLEANPMFNKKAAKVAKVSDVAKATKQIFAPAQTVKEAEEIAAKFGVVADYSKYDISVANAINETMQLTIDEFGSHALDSLKTIGTDVKKGREGGYDWFSGKLSLSRVRQKDALHKMGERTRKANRQYPGMPYFSADGDMHTIHHEFGHIVHSSLGGSLDTASTKLDREIIEFMRDKQINVVDEVSYYASTKHEELIAECIAQYYGGTAKEITNGIVAILKKHS